MTPLRSSSRRVGLALGVLTILMLAVGCSSSDEPHRRFEYQLSFKGPHLVQRDGSIPFWTHGGREYCLCIHLEHLIQCDSHFAWPWWQVSFKAHLLTAWFWYHLVHHAMSREVRPTFPFASKNVFIVSLAECYYAALNAALQLNKKKRVQPGEVACCLFQVAKTKCSTYQSF